MRRWLLLLPFLLPACREDPRPPPPPPPPPAAPPPTAPAAPPAPAITLPWAPTQTQPPAAEPLESVILQLRERATPARMAEAAAFFTEKSRVRLRQSDGSYGILPVTLQQQLSGPFAQIWLDGGRVGLASQGKGFTRTAWFFLEHGHWRLDAGNTAPAHPPDPGPDDPLNVPIALADAVTGLAGDGPLYATLHTDQGDIHCVLHERQVPDLVANFVALARGLRGARAESGAWRKQPFYNGLLFHRAEPGIWAVVGDPTSRGPGGAGFRIADHLDLTLRHDKPGVLSFVTVGRPNTASAQIGLFAKPAPWADDHHLPFGLCREVQVIDALSRQPVRGEVLRSVEIQRGAP